MFFLPQDIKGFVVSNNADDFSNNWLKLTESSGQKAEEIFKNLSFSLSN